VDFYERALTRYRSHSDAPRHRDTTLLGDIVVELLDSGGLDPVIVDLGAGSGELVEEVRRRTGRPIHAVDASPAMVTAARENGVDVVLGDFVEWLDACRTTIDLAIASDVIEHLDRQTQLDFLDAVRSRLSDTGVLVIKTVNARGLFSRQVMYGDITHQAFLTPESAAQLVGLADMRIERVIGTAPRTCDHFGRMRKAAWQVISAIALLVRVIETGKRQRIWTENMILVVRPEAAAGAVSEVAHPQDERDAGRPG
jgi:2-polyprenyl-3-methyl-5-hydroxy-6-metoxy-1,4-benzoquinol methylase